MPPYRYTNLTNAVKDKQSPLRRYLDQRFPNTREIQADYRSRSGELQVGGGEANPGTLGAAFDFQVRFVLDPTVPPIAAALAFAGRPDDRAVITEVMRCAELAVHRDSGGESLGRACWALALCTEVYRVGLMPGSPLVGLLDAGRFTVDALLALAPSDGLRQLSDMGSLAARNLLPSLNQPLHLGPTFDGSQLCSADADLIASGLLLEIKTHLGAKNQRTGTRTDTLSLLDLYQVLAYVLFDSSDTYRITDVGLYSARYGSLVTWPLAEALQTLAGEPVDLAHERARVWSLLDGPTR